MSDVGWTDERVATLKRMFADGKSASEIQASLGLPTRNSVIGKIHRLGLSRYSMRPKSGPRPKEGPSVVPPQKPLNQVTAAIARNKSPKTPKGVRTSNNNFVPRQSPAAAAAGAARGRVEFKAAMDQFECTEATDLPPEAVADTAVSLLEAKDHHCRFPMGAPGSSEFRFCGRNKHGNHPYCAAHCRVVYQPHAPRPLRREGFAA